MALTYVAIATVTVGSGGASSIEFTSIPATYTDLVVKVSCRTTTTGYNVLGAYVYFNSDTTNGNYTYKRIRGQGTTVYSDSSIIPIVASGATSDTFGNFEIYIPNYAGSTNKSFSVDSVSENNATNAEAAILAGLWSNTSAITSIKVSPESGNFAQYSTATLFGIKNS